MKTNKYIAILATALTVVACGKYKEDVQHSSLDTSRTPVASFDFNEAASLAENAVVFDIDGSAATKAGATSYTLYLSTDLDAKEVGNAGKTIIVEASEEAMRYAAKGLDNNAIYAVMIRANYPGFVHSAWTYIPERDGKRMGVSPKIGKVELVFKAPAMRDTDCTDKKVNIEWDPVAYAKSYTLQYKAASAADFTVVSGLEVTEYEIKGLTPSTSYTIQLQAVKDDATTEFTSVDVKTKEPSKFDPNMSTADQVVEFFAKEAAGAAGPEDVFTLTADIDMAGKTIVAAKNFSGTLDGQGHALKNLKLTAPLFENVSGEIKNLTVEGTLDYACEDGPETGLALAAVAARNSGNMSKVTSKINVTVNAKGILSSPVIAGVVAIQEGGKLSEVTNEGKISVTHGGTKNVDAAGDMGLALKPFSVVGGVNALDLGGVLEKCQNKGEIVVVTTDNSKVTARHYIGGINGSPWNAQIKDCVNDGKLTADFTATSATTAGKQVYIAGISGGRNGDASDYDGADIIGCTNNAEITLNSIDAANYYLAGIAGQSQCEAAKGLTGPDSYGKRIMKGCTNNGKLVKKGNGQVRLGGLSGGACTCEDCVNNGEIVVENTIAASAIGGLVGYPTQPLHTLKNCQQLGNITCSAAVDCGVGGMFGQGGNTEQHYYDCKVKCTMTCDAKNNVGILFGTTKTLTKAITCENFKIGGTIVKGGNKVELSGSNMGDWYVSDAPAQGGVVTATAGGTITVTAAFE